MTTWCLKWIKNSSSCKTFTYSSLLGLLFHCFCFCLRALWAAFEFILSIQPFFDWSEGWMGSWLINLYHLSLPLFSRVSEDDGERPVMLVSLSTSAEYQQTLNTATPRTIRNITSFLRHQNGHKWSTFTLWLHPQSFLFSYETLGLGEDVYKYRLKPFKMKALSSGRLLQSATQLSPWQLLPLQKCYTTLH